MDRIAGSCQRRHSMLSVRPCSAASLLYKLATAASETYGLLTKREVKMA